MLNLRNVRFRGLIATMSLALLATTSLASAAVNRYRANARLFGPTLTHGQARYEERQKPAGLLRRFTVEVEHGTPGTPLTITLNGNTVGTMTPDSLGHAEFELRTPQFIDSPDDGQPMPANFPQVVTGDIVAVGSISGVFFVVNTPNGSPPPPAVQNYRLRGNFTGGAPVGGHAEYRERFRNGGLERRFTVEIENASPGATFQVSVNGQVVGNATTNALGFAEFKLRTAAFIDSPDDGLPMPASFPSLQDGAQVAAGAMTTVLHPTNGGGGSGSGGGGSGSGGGGSGGGGSGGSGGGGGADDPPNHG